MDRDIGVAEQAGMGATVGVETKPMEDFEIFCATPLPPTPPESAGNIEPSGGSSFGSACLFSGRGHLPRHVHGGTGKVVVLRVQDNRGGLEELGVV